jgi:surface antigen
MSRYLLMIATSALFCSHVALAQPNYDPNDRRGGSQGGYSNGYDNRQYDSNRGNYRSDDRSRRGDQNYARDGYRRAYDNCQQDRQNRQMTGAAVGGAAGGLLGNQIAGRGSRSGGTIAGILLGAIAGYAVTSDLDCNDRAYAERTYTRGLDGQIGQRYDWRNDQDRDSGYFTPTREYKRDNYTCRDWVATTYREGRRMNRRGSSCRYEDGSWYSQRD